MTGSKKDFFKFAGLGLAISLLCGILFIIGSNFAVKNLDWDPDSIVVIAPVLYLPWVIGVYLLIKSFFSKQILKAMGFLLGVSIMFVIEALVL